MEYLLKASAVIAIFYACYKLFLQRDTFFESNRWFLLIGLITAFALPFVVIPIYIEYTPMPIQNFVINDAPTLVEVTEAPFNIWQYAFVVYIIGVIIFSIRFLVQLGSLALLIVKNKKHKQNGFTFIETQNQTPPFSFFRWIVYNPNEFNKEELQHIIAHEKVHVNQYHSIDILLSQLASIVFWFNPITWFYKKDLQQNLEFIADYKAQNQSNCKKSYQHLLLKTSVPNQHIAITNNFYNSLIKKRIVMLHKSKSKKINLLKYALVLPFLALFLMGFNTEDVYVEKVSEKSIPNTFQNKLETPKATKPDSLKIIFNKDLSDKDLKKIKSNLEKNKITFTYTNLKRNNKGEIINIFTKFESDGGYYIFNAIDRPIKPFYFLRSETASGVGYTEKEIHKAKQPTIKKHIKPFSVTITKNFTDKDFKDAIKRGKEKGVTLKFSKIKRNAKNEIIGIFAEFKTENGAGNYTLNSGKPIHPFAYEQDNDGFGFGGVSKNKVKVVGYGNVKLKEGYKVISADSIIFNESNNFESIVSTHTDSSNKSPWKVTVGVNATDSIDTTPWRTVVGYPAPTKIFVRGIETKDGKKPLYILDDVEISEEKMQTINPNNIASINVLKDETATIFHGSKAKDGVVIITTKDYKNSKIKLVNPLNSSNYQEKHIILGKVTSSKGKGLAGANVVIKGTTSGTLTDTEGNYKIKASKGDELVFSLLGMLPQEITVTNNDEINVKLKAGITSNKYTDKALLIIDGKEVKDKKIEDLDQGAIESVSVFNGRENLLYNKYGKKAKDGVIIITTKNSSKDQKTKTTKTVSDIIDAGYRTDNKKHYPFYIIDGKEAKNEAIKKIKPDDIESLIVLKGEKAIKKYGKKAKDGVIEITTKKKN